MSQNKWLPSQQGFKFARRTVSVTGKQRHGSPKTNRKYLWRGRRSEDTNTSVKCLGCTETVTVEEKFSATNSRSGNLFYSMQQSIKNQSKTHHILRIYLKTEKISQKECFPCLLLFFIAVTPLTAKYLAFFFLHHTLHFKILFFNQNDRLPIQG